MAPLQPLSLCQFVLIDWWEQNMQHVSMECGVTCHSVPLHAVSIVAIVHDA